MLEFRIHLLSRNPCSTRSKTLANRSSHNFSCFWCSLSLCVFRFASSASSNRKHFDCISTVSEYLIVVYPPASQGPKKRKYFDILRPICAQRPWICSETCLHHRKITFKQSDEGSRLIDVWKSRKRDLRSVVTSARFVPKTSFEMSF